MQPKKFFTSIAVVVAVTGAGFLTAAPASAAPSGCNPGQGCTYEDANYGKGHINFYENVKHFANVGYWAPTLHPATDNAASSAFNNGQSGRAARWFDDPGYKGPYKELSKGNGTTNLGYDGHNDKTSSACFIGYC